MSWLVANSLVAAAMAVLVLAVGRCRTAPAVMHGLWLFVLLKLVTPPLFAVPVDLSWWNGPSGPGHLVVVSGDLASDAARSAGAADGAGAVAAAAMPVAAPAVVPAAPWPWERVALAAWALGSAGMFVWFAAGLWRGHRRLRALGPVPPAMQREVAGWAASLGVRMPALRDDPAACSPYVWSFGRTCLVIPVRALAAVPPKGRAAVLVHELAHLRRGDHWLAHAELLLAVVLWWHPLFWFARARLRLWGELACDAWAVASVPDATIDYATVLVEAVARPETAVAPAVLAARPAARAAFERRLQMILNENVPCRASRAWWLPFSSLALGLFTVPVAAQHGQQEPVHVEIRVNGKQVDELSAAERKALLHRLLLAETKHAEKREAKDEAKVAETGEEAAQDPQPRKGGKKDGKKGEAKPGKKLRAAVRIDPLAEPHAGHGAMPSGREIHDALRAGLAEARAEIEGDEDLRELGITEEVTRLIDDIAAGKGMGEGLDAVVKAAMKGAGKMVEKELRADPDLRELGITVDVEALLGSLFSGQGDFEAQLQALVEKALRGALHGEGHAGHGEAHAGHGEEPVVEEPPAAKKKVARKAKLELR